MDSLETRRVTITATCVAGEQAKRKEEGKIQTQWITVACISNIPERFWNRQAMICMTLCTAAVAASMIMVCPVICDKVLRCLREAQKLAQPTCVLESDFGFKINCAFKKSGLFRIHFVAKLPYVMAASTTNVMFASAPLTRRASALHLDSETDNKDEPDRQPAPAVWSSVARRRTDLVPTLPAPRAPGRAYSMTRLDKLPSRPLSGSPSMHHLNRTQPRSGDTTPGSRPASALSSAPPVMRRPAARKPRPASIAGTGVNTPKASAAPAPGEGKPPLARRPRPHDRARNSSASPGRPLSPSPAVNENKENQNTNVVNPEPIVVQKVEETKPDVAAKPVQIERKKRSISVEEKVDEKIEKVEEKKEVVVEKKIEEKKEKLDKRKKRKKRKKRIRKKESRAKERKVRGEEGGRKERTLSREG
ncbi:hypothetical protein MSG28_012014 [Choristoneura fumiferana]|uniref:Uncharacterized protein n=1 Tax=Choristoneura fumiferana TaxID=7141 RepID=A0ACC0KN87_CHOFU|nr:hypothetical protein MSG28_012014 [Choristoneura fumiferana]